MIDDLVAKRAESSDMLTWRILHDDDDGMTYGLPSDKNILEMHLKNANGHIVWRTGYAIGCFSVVVDEMGMATGV